MDEQEQGKLVSRFILLLQHDPSSEVRKSCLWNIESTTQTLPYLLKRTRDVDALVRKSVYLRLLEDGEFNLKQLSKDHKGELLKAGLYDRDASVKKACLKLVCEKWVGEGVDIFSVLDKLDVNDPICAEAAIKAYLGMYSDIKIVYSGTLLYYLFLIQ